MKDNKVAPIHIITPERLNNYYIKKLSLSDEKKVKIQGWELKHKKLKENKDNTVELYYYTSEVIGNRRKKLINRTQIIVENTPAFYFYPKNKIIIILLILFLTMLVIFRVYSYKSIPIPNFNILGDEKINQDDTQRLDDSIIYVGFPSEFTINKNIRYLSVQNSIENNNKFYTAVKIMEGDNIIYDMKDNVISPGKYINIDLYSILNDGKHTITIYQTGYIMDKNFTQVSTSTNQTVTVLVNKKESL